MKLLLGTLIQIEKNIYFVEKRISNGFELISLETKNAIILRDDFCQNIEKCQTVFENITNKLFFV